MPSIIQLPDIDFLHYGWVLALHVQNRGSKHVISHHRTIFLKRFDHEAKMVSSLSLLYEISSTSASLTPLEMDDLVTVSLIVSDIWDLLLSF